MQKILCAYLYYAFFIFFHWWMICPPVSANGNYSHNWIAMDSLNYVEKGDLRDLLTREDLLVMLRNGAMYPDGGYGIDDDYGEISHWEPFHLTYLDWIRTQFKPPWSDEAAQHIAFLMGMAAHGLSDQLYDGMYLTRHEFYDINHSDATLGGVDTATDACFAATQGPMPPLRCGFRLKFWLRCMINSRAIRWLPALLKMDKQGLLFLFGFQVPMEKRPISWLIIKNSIPGPALIRTIRKFRAALRPMARLLPAIGKFCGRVCMMNRFSKGPC